MPQYTIAITERQTAQVIEHAFLEDVVRRVLQEEQIETATISLALVNDAEIHEMNREFLGHDYPTDVISFLLNDASNSFVRDPNCSERDADAKSAASVECGVGEDLHGELIVSSETAIREAAAHGWSPKAELVLYVVHGLLHLCGYDDLTDEARPAMRSRERDLLAIWGFLPTGLEP